MDRILPVALIAVGAAVAALIGAFGGSGGTAPVEAAQVEPTQVEPTQVEPTQVEPEQERADSAVGERLAADLDVFYDLDVGYEVHKSAVRAFIASAKQWIADQRPPIVNGAKFATGEIVAEVVDIVRSTTGTWVEVDLARSLLKPWHELVTEDVAAGGRLGGSFFATHLPAHAQLFSRLDGPRAGLNLLGDEVLDRYVAADAAAMRRCLTLRADVHRILGEFGQAYADLARRQDFDTDGGASPAEMYWLRSVEMRIEIDLGRLDRAEAHLFGLSAIAAADPNVTTRWRASMCNVEYFAALGSHESVLRATDDVLAEYSEADRRTLDGEVLYDAFLLHRATAISRSRTDQESLEEAEVLLSRLIGQAALPHGLRMIAVVERAALALKRGDPEQAMAALEMVDREFGDRVTSRLFRNRIAARRLEIALDLGDEALRERATRELALTMDSLLTSWGELDLVAGGIGFLHFEERRHALSLLVSSILEDGRPDARARAFDLILRADAHSTLARTIGAPAATSRQLVEMCEKENAAIVVLLTTRAVTHRFFVARSGVLHEECEDEGTLARRIERVGRALARQPAVGVVEASFQDVDGDLAFLAEQLLPGAIRSRTEDFSCVYVLAPDVCGRAPFEALLIDDGRYLGLTVPVVRLPSTAAALMIAARDARTTADERNRVEMFALSGVEHSGIGIDLSLAELNELTRNAGVSINLQKGASATRASFLNSMTRGAELFVVWSHGVSDRRLPIPAGILVARSKADRTQVAAGGPKIPDGLALLGAAQISEALMAADEGSAPRVVLLAACDTAKGHVRTGDGAAGHLGGVFLGAGSSAVLLTERPIEREAALLFVKTYVAAYLNRKTATTVAVAALTARRAVASEEGFESPHYWAALHVVGWGGAVPER